MPKAFLSHSSKDKIDYVDIVAVHLGKHNIIYDKITFEEGLKNIEEIEKGLGVSELFVLFLSNNSLNSSWVKKELRESRKLLSQGLIKRIFPLIIDPGITYQDSRIPEWMQKEYNLKYIGRPTVAARRIEQRLRVISWESHPQIKEKVKLFVGRNDLIQLFEERFDDFDKPKPICFIAASGIRNVGRKAFLQHCFEKTNVISDSYKPSRISLGSHESIEDFLLKVYDLGFTSFADLTKLLHKSQDYKVEIAIKLVSDLRAAKELLFIDDDGCIVNREGELIAWFEKLINAIKSPDIITFGIASSYRVYQHKLHNNYIYHLNIPELAKSERNGLLKRYAEMLKLELTQEDFNFFAGLLTGLPEQVFYAVDLIKDIGTARAKKESNSIIEYSKQKVSMLIQKYESDSKSFNFLCLLANFDFISYEFIFEIVGDDVFYKTLLDEFLALAICEDLGANKEYIRLNDAIKDYILRIRWSLPGEYKEKLKEHLEIFLKTYKSEEKDAADILYSMKEMLLAKKEIDDKYLIPSHFLRTMKELYDRYNKYSEVINLADRVLLNEAYMDEQIKQEIRYFLCASLARSKNHRFLSEVQKITGAEHDFLFGFYYRLTQNPSKALERFLKVLEVKPNHQRAKREMVSVYIYIEDFENALRLAKENYERDQNNPFHIQAYIQSIIKAHKAQDNKKQLNDLLDALSRIKTERAEEMYLTSKAEYMAFVNNDELEAMKYINAANEKFKDKIYPKLTKFSICERFNNIEEMQNVLHDLEAKIDSKHYFHNAFISRKAIYLSRTGKLDDGLKLINKELKNFPQSALDKLQQKLKIIVE
jgi:hypothetical protein